MVRIHVPGCLLFACLAVLLPAPLAPAAPPSVPAEKIDQIVKDHGYADDGPGVAVMVIGGGKVLFQRGYGLANLKEKTRIDPHTTFELASVSKTFTATAFLILHDRGRIGLDDDVRKHIPELPEYHSKKPIRVHDLLQHTSGLPEYFQFENVHGQHAKYLNDADYAREFAAQRKKFPAIFKPGEKYQYCNSNFLLLALLIERLSGKSYGTFLHEEIFAPLHMDHTWVYEHPKGEPKFATQGYVNAIGYTKGKSGPWKESWGSPPFRHEELLTVGDGAIWTCLEDMAHWDAAVREGKLLKGETWRKAFTPSKTEDGKTNDYGFGWGVTLAGDGKLKAIGHSGSWGGFLNDYHRDVQDDWTIVFLSNRGDRGPAEMRKPIRSLFFGEGRGKK